MLRIGLVAGEHSGDSLGADLMRALCAQYSGALQFEGVPGPKMREAGCRTVLPMEDIAAGGLTEILTRLPQLWSARQKIIHYFLEAPPDIFVGIDSPDFNLGIERKLKKTGIKTVHYVSPSIWAWRQKRIFKIGKAADLVLTLLPFEANCYEKHNIPVHYVGHPLCEQTLEGMDKQAQRRALGLSALSPVIAVLPGSRLFEIKYLGRLFLDTVAWCLARRKDLQFIVPMVSEKLKDAFATLVRDYPMTLPIQITVGHGASHQAMAAADAVLTASGTATLECLLMNRPMVVAYRLSELTYRILKRMVQVSYCALPNLLSGRALVPEFIQAHATPEHLGRSLFEYLTYPEETARLMQKYQTCASALKQNASHEAAKRILEVL